MEVKVLGVNRQKKQIRLSMKALEEKPVKPAKTSQKETPESGQEQVVPTAMEFALREAMDSVKSRHGEILPRERGRRKSAGNKSELERILARTLQHKSEGK